MCKNHLIDEELLSEIVMVLNDAGLNLESFIRREECKRLRDRILAEIAKEKHCSVLEWHPVSENPNKNNDFVIIKLKNGKVAEDFVNFYDLPDDAKTRCLLIN